MPKRIQRKRVRGWRMPENTVNCTRPGPYGNSYRIGETYGGYTVITAKSAVMAFENDIHWNDRNSDRLMNGGLTTAKIRRELRGKDLACWCRLCDQHRDGKPVGAECPDCAPCHLDTLLKVANR